MNRIYGTINDFSYIHEDESRYIIAYDYEAIDESHGTWYEIYIYKKQQQSINLDMVRNGILDDIDSQTDEKILTGFTWEDNDGVEVMVWLSEEQQRNYSAAVEMVREHPEKLPQTFKLSDSEDRVPHFKTFTTYEALDEFHVAVFDYINGCLNEGFKRKYTINWQDYQDALDELFPPQPVVEPETPSE